MDPRPTLIQRVLALPKWLPVLIIVVLSVTGSVVATVLLKYAQGQPIALFVPYMLVPTTVPILVSAPIAAFILGLMHRLEAVRRDAERLSRTDLLTGALNRRRFIELAQRELDRARFTQAPTSVLLLDIDDFKQVNDRHGHDAGDAVLKMVAAACERTLRPGDPFARWGGEEFVALLPGARPGDAIGVALRVRDSIAAGVLEHGSQSIRVTASIGVAGIGAGGQALDLLISRADEAMYRAKRSGKNAAFVSDLPPQPAADALPATSAVVVPSAAPDASVTADASDPREAPVA